MLGFTALDAVYVVLAGVTAPFWARKRRGGWGERLGRAPALPAPSPGRARVLLHAVSVGEVNALRVLVPMLSGRADVVVCTTTDTGMARARALFGGVCPVVRYPLDFSWSVARFLDAIRPDVVGLVELELWPNFVSQCVRRSIPVAVINGRLSERSFRGYRRWRAFVGRMFRSVRVAGVQDAAYAARFREMGVPDVRVTGSMKWDSASVMEPGAPLPTEAQKLAAEFGIDRAKPLVVAGSTAEDEEELLASVCPAGVQLLCAPRKPEHFDEAAAALPGCVRLSLVRKGMPLRGTGRFLLDTIGDLRWAYMLADVIVVGRSFGTLFGSDPIEPIALGKATLIGPRFGDFASIVGDLTSAGVLTITTREDLASDLRRLLGDAGRRAELGRLGVETVRAGQGASRRHAELLLALAGDHTRASARTGAGGYDPVQARATGPERA